MIEQSPAVRALGVELGRAIRLDRARRVRRHRTLAAVAVLVLLAGGALRLAPGLAHSASTESAVLMLPSSEAGGSAVAGGGPALIGCINPTRAGTAGAMLILWQSFGTGSCEGSTYGTRGTQVTAVNGSRERLAPPPETSSPQLRDAPWLHRFAAFVN
jgi:hypothetical protein